MANEAAKAAREKKRKASSACACLQRETNQLLSL